MLACYHASSPGLNVGAEAGGMRRITTRRGNPIVGLLVMGLVAMCAPRVAASDLKLVPPIDKRRAAERTIKDIFAKEFRKRGKEDQLALATTFLKQGVETKDDPASRYQLLDMARTIAARHGDVQLALKAVDQLAAYFIVDVVKMKLDALNTIKRISRTKEDSRALAYGYLRVAADATDRSGFEKAVTAARSAQRYAKMAMDVKLHKEITEYTKRLEEQRRAFLRIASDLKTVSSKPNDAGANLRVGKFYFVRMRNWPLGLRHLKLGGDATWAPVAKADAANPKSAADQLKLADRWWDLAATLPKTEQESVRYRAAYWYEKSLAGATGLAKLKAQKRMEGIDKAVLSELAAGKSGPAVPGPSGAASEPAKGAVGKALPTPDEVKKYKAVMQAVKTGGEDEKKAFWELHNALHNRLAANPSTWKDEDFKSRLASEVELNRVRRQIGLNVATLYTNVMRAWPEFVAAAPSAAKFLARLKEGNNELRKYGLTDVTRHISENTQKAIDLYFKRNEKTYPNKAAKLRFCQWLQQNGIDKAVIQAFQGKL